MPFTFVPANYSFSLGTLLAFVVLIVCIILFLIDHTLSARETLVVLATLALARLT